MEQHPKIGNACLDLTKQLQTYIALPTIDFVTTYANTPLSISFWFKTNTDKSIYNLFGDYRDGRYFLYGTGNNINLFVDFLPTETIYQTFYNNISSMSVNYGGLGDTTNNAWIHLVWVFGNISTHKLYLNGKFISSISNTQTLTTNYSPSFGQNYLQSFLRGYGADMRFYAREITANEVLALYETAGIDYQLNLNIEET